MKKKFLILTLCFTLIFSSVNLKKSYADGGVISLPMIGVVSSLAVGSGIILKNIDDLYDIGRLFYDYIEKKADLTWDTVNLIFASGVSILNNNKVSVDSKFLDVVKGFFDTTFGSSASDVTYYGLLPVYPLTTSIPSNYLDNGPIDTMLNVGTQGRRVYINVRTVGSQIAVGYGYIINDKYQDFYYRNVSDLSQVKTALMVSGSSVAFWISNGSYSGYSDWFSSFTYSDSVTFPYNGGYSWDGVSDNIDEGTGELSLPIPGSLGNLVGQTKDEFWNNTDNLVGNGDLSLPGVDNPSIGVDGSVSFPGSNAGSVPDEGIWSKIKDFIISLVVPSDTFWTDTWGGMYQQFTSSFPMVDMDNFNSLVTNEKKFPNIDIDIMGVHGRVVNGDVINSIVDWLRPIIAGFMMLCLMLFNYRKIYKLIRNSEPFGGIAPGTSDFKTGISEYNQESNIDLARRQLMDTAFDIRVEALKRRNT